MRVQIRQGQGGHGLAGLHRGAGHMRCQHHVLQITQLCRHTRFVGIHIQGRTGNHFLLQSVNQGGLIDHRATRHIDQKALVTQSLQHLGVDQVAGGRTAWGDGHQKIYIRCQFFGRRVVGVGQGRHRMTGGVGDGHVKSRRTFGDGLANATNAHQAQPSATHFGLQGERSVDPIAVANKLISLRNASRNREHQAQSQIGDVVVEHPRCVADLDATLHGANNIHAVVAHAANRNEFQGGKQRH